MDMLIMQDLSGMCVCVWMILASRFVNAASIERSTDFAFEASICTIIMCWSFGDRTLLFPGKCPADCREKSVAVRRPIANGVFIEAFIINLLENRVPLFSLFVPAQWTVWSCPVH